MHSRWFCYSQRTWRRVIIDISLWNFNFLNFLGCHTDEFCFMLLVYLHTCKVTSRNLWYPLLVTPHVLQCIILKFACSLVNESRPMPPTGYMRCNWSCSLRGRVQSQQLFKKRVPRPEGSKCTRTTKVTIRNFHSVSCRLWPFADSRGSGSKALHKHNTVVDVELYTRRVHSWVKGYKWQP